MHDLPEVDPYVEFAMALPDGPRRRLGRLLEQLVTRDDGGWTISGQSADEFLQRHREYLQSIIDTDYPDAFPDAFPAD
ncbi:hypothetical protein [Tsukamurella sp. NPDC003166]|uniref:hypothetical protein n=1 Tax=Tsukamurella sp. NPDC003166 TaxID=3154444 RepID=UPI0033AFF3F4